MYCSTIVKNIYIYFNQPIRICGTEKKNLLKRNKKERLKNNILIRIEFYDGLGIVKWDGISNKVVFWDGIIV